MTPKERMGASIFSLLLLFSSWTTAYSSLSYGATLLNIAKEWNADPLTLAWGSRANSDPCNVNDRWEFVTCDESGQLTALNLSNKGLTGPVPSGISELVSLVSLDLCSAPDIYTPSRNKVTGDLSPIGHLTNLRLLNVSFNILNEQFPDAVLQLTNLVTLILDNARLTGPIPKDLGKLVNLQHLHLGNNSLTGSLLPELGNLINLVELFLWGNTFDSQIPKKLGNLVNLSFLTLHDCSLWGGLPPEFGNLKSIKTLYLYSNHLTGVIPATWQNMKQLGDLNLRDNWLSRQFPKWILSAPNLQEVELSKNFLYGEVPNLDDALGKTKLTSLKFKCNFFTGNESGATLSHDKVNVSQSANCFSNIDPIDANKNKCFQVYESCTAFFKGINGDGCPKCPIDQILFNSSSCVCGKDNGISQYQKGVKIIVPILSVVLFLLVAYIAYSKWRSYVKKQAVDRFGRKFSRKEMHKYWEFPKEIQRFTFGELAKATGNFDKDHEIGMGSFGKVFRGVLENGKNVAIKHASATSMQGGFEFHNEVLLLSRLHHRNLVHLEGFCEDEGHQILVYEYMVNGNLHTRLFLCDDKHTLDWYRRLEIALGVAQGLDYLHSFADPPVIHRDVKPSNILLDENLVAKLADFGISKATVEFDTHISTIPAGTPGYIDPQYFLRRHLTTASDVYGFGVVLLELLTGQKAIDYSHPDELNLVEWVQLKLIPEGIETIVDPRLHNSYPRQVYYDAVKLAINCAAFNKNDRPSMKAVVSVLESYLWAASPIPSEILWQPSESFQRKMSNEDCDSSDTAIRDIISTQDTLRTFVNESICSPR